MQGVELVEKAKRKLKSLRPTIENLQSLGISKDARIGCKPAKVALAQRGIL